MKAIKSNIIAIAAVLVILVGIGGFVAGMKYQQHKTPAGQFGLNGNFAGRNGRFGQGANRFNGGNRPVIGTILSSDQNSVTVKMADGSSKIVLLSGTTQIIKSSNASTSDLQKDARVAVIGTQNRDGSVSANSIQINPIMFTMGQGNMMAAPSASPKAY